MGSFLDKPLTTHHTEVKEGNGLKAGLASMQGWRVDQEVRGGRRARDARSGPAAARPRRGGRARGPH